MNDVAGVYVVWGERVLAQHRDEKAGILYPGYWCAPGGLVEEGEDFEGAARRELLEETGVVAGEMFLLVEERYVRSDGTEAMRHSYWTRYDGVQKVECLEGAEMRFLTLEELGRERVIPGQERLFRMAVERAAG